jgi:peptidyl-prolyl cis-trans isomerase A (cyclophilin A)
MASKKSRRRRSNPEVKKSPLEKKEVKIGIFILAIIVIVAIAAAILMSGGNDTEENANTIPEAIEDYSVVGKNSEKNQIDVLANDIYNDNDSLSITETTTPSHGSVEINGSYVIYSPSADFSGVDTFEYTIDDSSGGTNTAQIHVIVADENPISLIDTSMGMIVVELYEDKVPITAGNFINLANDGFYDGLIFHRVMQDFMIQGGCPEGTGMGGPGYTIDDEFHEDLKHDSPGILSMANSGPNTGGSQFFITVAETPWLDGGHAVFGKVIEGMDVAYAISELDPDNTDANNKPLTDVIINSITIENQ